jgi:hypothetical protein
MAYRSPPTLLPAAFVTSKGHILMSNGKPVVIQ